jgi:hypothetical protein
MRTIDTSSKMALKMSCLAACSGDVARAEKMYNFLSDGIKTMPDYTPTPPTVVEQIKQTASDVFGFVKENQGDILQAWNYIQSMRAGQPIVPPQPLQDIPPLPNT